MKLILPKTEIHVYYSINPEEQGKAKKYQFHLSSAGQDTQNKIYREAIIFTCSFAPRKSVEI